MRSGGTRVAGDATLVECIAHAASGRRVVDPGTCDPRGISTQIIHAASGVAARCARFPAPETSPPSEYPPGTPRRGRGPAESFPRAARSQSLLSLPFLRNDMLSLQTIASVGCSVGASVPHSPHDSRQFLFAFCCPDPRLQRLAGCLATQEQSSIFPLLRVIVHDIASTQGRSVGASAGASVSSPAESHVPQETRHSSSALFLQRMSAFRDTQLPEARASCLHGISTSQPRRRRDSSPLNIHVGVAATRLRKIRAVMHNRGSRHHREERTCVGRVDDPRDPSLPRRRRSVAGAPPQRHRGVAVTPPRRRCDPRPRIPMRVRAGTQGDDARPSRVKIGVRADSDVESQQSPSQTLGRSVGTSEGVAGQAPHVTGHSISSSSAQRMLGFAATQPAHVRSGFLFLRYDLRDVDIQWNRLRGPMLCRDVAEPASRRAATWIFRGDESRRRRGRDVDRPRRDESTRRLGAARSADAPPPSACGARFCQKMEWFRCPPPLNLIAPAGSVRGDDAERQR